ncbi:MAG TPA: DUF2934 domain-containing protein [Rariglobus sp.]
MQKNSVRQSASPLPPTQADISERATKLWENYGRPEGRDLEIWLEAEHQLMGVDAAVEGRRDTSVSARAFDKATADGKPRSRIEKPAAETKKPEISSARARR